MTTETKQPQNLDEIVDIIIGQIKEQEGAEEHVKKDGIPHHGAGTGIRNGYYLWWSEGLRDRVFADNPNADYPKEKPAIVAWFNERDIYHADDMSGIISEAVQAKLKGETYDMAPTIERYKKHWKKYGFKNGIPLEENKQ